MLVAQERGRGELAGLDLSLCEGEIQTTATGGEVVGALGGLAKVKVANVL